ncbi:hypothetical protein [Sandaracinus amylolyticus]|uniref:hypothetical protein n=1 Tax=Sandaracinus amylolyticus TaxID=927083 RepID=UPI001F1DE0E6|nr:hypothetical protein [Sandaracinus amylolyticus]UJR85164.1 Hypothetical protein I5071_72440 [Sandaracinus amylolyticus]
MIARALIALAALLLVPSPVHAQDTIARRAMSVRFEDGAAHVDAEASDLADAALRRRLSSGLPQTLVTRVYAFHGDTTTPIAIGVRSCRITHDPWGLTYRVQIQTESSDRSETMRSVEQVIDACLDLRALRVGRSRDWAPSRGQSVWLAAIIELNPLSPDTVHRIRRWLARPDGAGVEGDAFFGSFVSLFVNRRIGEAERTIRYRSSGEVRVP